MSKTTPNEYIRQTKSEMKKVTWPSRKEVTVSTIFVFIMVIMAALFLFMSDQLIAFVIKTILGI